MIFQELEHVQEWLDANDLEVRTPSIRSSDYGMCRRDPFLYYLVRKLGLIYPFDLSSALNRGTWFHRYLPYFMDEPSIAKESTDETLAREKQKWRELCVEHGKEPSLYMEREERDRLIAYSWWENAACSVPISREHGTLQEYLVRDSWMFLGAEVLVRHGFDVCQHDLLFFNPQGCTLWIVDAKTCSGSAKVRLSTCPIEFQTLHYLNITQLALPQIIARWDLPHNTRLGGMIHAAVQKCPLEFGREDRPFTEYAHELQRGPRRGQVEMRRTYDGEPEFDLYLQRQREWYTATGRYETRIAELAEDPPVNLSFSYWHPSLAKPWRRMREVVTMYRDAEEPADFPMNADTLRPYRGARQSPYAPFYLLPPQYWPNVVEHDGFVKVNRDEGLTWDDDCEILPGWGDD